MFYIKKYNSLFMGGDIFFHICDINNDIYIVKDSGVGMLPIGLLSFNTNQFIINYVEDSGVGMLPIGLFSFNTNQFIINYCLDKYGIFANYKIAEYMFAVCVFILKNKLYDKNLIILKLLKRMNDDLFTIKANTIFFIYNSIYIECINREFLNLCKLI